MDWDKVIEEATSSLPDLGAEGGNAVGDKSNAAEDGMSGAAAGGENNGGEQQQAASSEAEQQQSQEQQASAASQAADNGANAGQGSNAFDFEGISGGLIKNVDDIGTFAAEHQRLLEENRSLKEKSEVNPFANEYSRTLNQMFADGKSEEQIEAFVSLNKLGEISELSPIEAMVQEKVLKDGRNPEIARKQIEKRFGITEFMSDEERELAQADLEDASKESYKYLQDFKKDLTTPTSQSPNGAVVDAVSADVIKTQIAPIKEKAYESFKSLGEINLNGKVDKDGKPLEDAVLFNMAVPDDFRKLVPDLLEAFHLSNNLAVTDESLKNAMEYVNFELFNQRGVELIQTACIHYGNTVEKRIREEYENQGGLTHRRGTGSAQANTDEFNSFIESDVLGRR
jgi:hypothetical protein